VFQKKKKKGENCMLQEYVSSVSDISKIYVASVVYRCCKSRPGCCTCWYDYTRMFQVCVQNVSFVLDVCCKCVYLDVVKVDLNVAYACILQTYVSSVLYVCLQVFHLDVAYVVNFFRRFHKCLYACFKCFICLFLCCNCCI
jgi:hypothetical protein